MKLKTKLVALLGGFLGLLGLAGMTSSSTPSPKMPGAGRIKNDLTGLDPRLLRVIKRARTLGASFVVVDGVRTVQEQQAAREAGASRYFSSDAEAPHVKGLAFDVWAIPDKESWQQYVELARVFARAAFAEGVQLKWGGSWMVLTVERNPEAQAAAYAIKKRQAGKTPFVDAGHFELVEDA